MRVSLRLRVLLLVAVVNVGVFSAGLFFLTRTLARDRRELQREYSELLDYTMQSTIDVAGELKVAQILRWPHWQRFDDAIILERKSIDALARASPRGVYLNPVGSSQRSARFDYENVLLGLGEAVFTAGGVAAAGGTAVPILVEGRVWGACWYRIDSDVSAAGVFKTLLPWFLASTLLLTLGTFWVLQRFVLDPVDTLAAGSRRVRAGDLSVLLPEPAHRDELTDLVRVFNEMTREVKTFHEHLEEEVARATAQARQAEAAAVRQRQLASMGELAAGIAHEINNPLGGLLNALDSLRRGDLSREKQAQYLELLRGGLERMQGTAGKLLRFTPRSSGPAPFSLVEAASDAIALARHRAEREGVTIELEADPGEPLVLGVRSELGQAVLNLIVNSLDALQPRGSGRIGIQVRREERELHLSIEDDGPGVPPERLERVADLFYTTKEVGKGTGLGLALVVSVVDAHGGRAQFSSPPGAGFRVDIWLPLWTGAPS